MKILQLCSKPPFPPKDGGCVAMDILTNGLIEAGNDVKVLAISTHKHPVDFQKLPKNYLQKTKFDAHFIDTKIKPILAFLNLFEIQSYNISRFYSESFNNKLIAILKTESFDIVQLESLFVTPYLQTIRNYSKAKVVLRSHNLEYFIWKKLAISESNVLKKYYLNFLANRLKKYEIAMLNKYDAIASISTVDTKEFLKLGCKIPVIDIPFGISLDKYTPDNSAVEQDSIFHLGAMDWAPNLEGVKWFLDNVWSLINAKYPNLKLYLAGRNMPNWLLELKISNVIVIGEVEDAQKFINSKSIMVVPLQSGSGVKVKIIEGMALAKAIISTSTGVEGIEVSDGDNILIANSPSDFLAAIDKCILDNKLVHNLGLNARRLIEQDYDNRVICEKLSSFYSKL